jgi:cytochrome c biogenesis protein CcmG, thiol:disulfide interchange protein DsbE
MIGGLLIGIGFGWVAYIAPANSAGLLSTSSVRTFVPELSTNQPGVIPKMAIKAGNQAPDFSLKSVDGREIRLSDFRGKPVLINLWATWCIPCQDEMRVIEKIFKDYSSAGLVVLGVNVTSQDSIQDVNETVKKYHLTYPILLDEAGHVSELYEMRGIPTSYFIDSNGILRRIQIGEILPKYLDNYLSEILPIM